MELIGLKEARERVEALKVEHSRAMELLREPARSAYTRIHQIMFDEQQTGRDELRELYEELDMVSQEAVSEMLRRRLSVASADEDAHRVDPRTCHCEYCEPFDGNSLSPVFDLAHYFAFKNDPREMERGPYGLDLNPEAVAGVQNGHRERNRRREQEAKEALIMMGPERRRIVDALSYCWSEDGKSLSGLCRRGEFAMHKTDAVAYSANLTDDEVAEHLERLDDIAHGYHLVPDPPTS